MSLDDFILTCFCWIDDALPTVTEGKRLRQVGSQPTMSDSEVITIEIVGSYFLRLGWPGIITHAFAGSGQ